MQSLKKSVNNEIGSRGGFFEFHYFKVRFRMILTQSHDEEILLKYSHSSNLERFTRPIVNTVRCYLECISTKVLVSGMRSVLMRSVLVFYL